MTATTTKNLLQPQWHSLPVPEVAQHLESNLETGLTQVEAEGRHIRFGPNQLVGKPRKSAWMRFLLQFNQPLLYILLAAGVITAFLGEWVDSGVIFAVTIINAIIGFVQDSKAENALAALAASVNTEATVLRDLQTMRVPSNQVVPGDLVWLAAGDKVPADLRLINVSNLTVDESGLTGESIPVEKDSQSLNWETALAERSNMAYAGSLVASGQGQGMVVAIANATETGRISQMMDRSSDTQTPITRKINKFSHKLLYVVLGLAVVVFAIGLSRTQSWVDVFTTTVAFAVAAIPEGLPAIVTITLAIGVSRLVRRNAIMRKLAAVETLGSTTVICSDKTGTLTENQMTVQGIYAGNQRYSVTVTGYDPDGEILQDDQPVDLANAPVLEECLRAGLLCHDSHLHRADGQYTIVGDPTEGALVVVAQKAGLTRAFAEAQMPRLAVIPFESQFQYMATLHQTHSGNTIYVKGSMEAIFKRCEQLVNAQGQLEPLDRDQIERKAEAVAKQGLRILAFAKKSVPVEQHSLDHFDLNRGLILLGLQGMIDPPRKAAISAVRACQSAGIQVKTIAGDHPLTATTIARMMKLSQRAEVISFTGKELGRMNKQEAQEAAESGVVFARVAPEQKLQLVRALQSKGEIVAMTGDGVNDAPALKQAELGIVMGITGTEVAKEAASTLLTDDNFASIAAAVEEGRTVYQNLLKARSSRYPQTVEKL